jgi:hypothetical protein
MDLDGRAKLGGEPHRRPQFRITDAEPVGRDLAKADITEIAQCPTDQGQRVAAAMIGIDVHVQPVSMAAPDLGIPFDLPLDRHRGFLAEQRRSGIDHHHQRSVYPARSNVAASRSPVSSTTPSSNFGMIIAGVQPGSLAAHFSAAAPASGPASATRGTGAIGRTGGVASLLEIAGSAEQPARASKEMAIKFSLASRMRRTDIEAADGAASARKCRRGLGHCVNLRYDPFA